MRFGPLPPRDAVGAVLAHTVRLDETTFRKGTVLGEADIRALVEAGVSRVTVAVLDEGDVGEDAAAEALAEAAKGPALRLRGPFTGRCNLLAELPGLVRVDASAVQAANGIDEGLTLATVPDGTRVGEGELVATAKVIPLAVARERLDAATACLGRDGPVLQVRPFRPLRAGLVLTTLPGDSGKLRARAEAVTRRRLESLGSSMVEVRTVPHVEEAVAEALLELRGRGCDLLLVLGASAVVDRADVVPRAVERAGGRVHRLGIPVDPGNLLLLASLDDDPGVPVVGIPGCARSSKRSGFDTVLERLAAGTVPTPGELASLGVGGLLREIPSRPQPRTSQPSGPEAGAHESPRRRVGALVLAAGRSRRMGDANKLLQDVEGRPMVATVVRRLRDSGVDPIVAVTGHQAAEVEAALESWPVRTVRNPRFDEGMATSITAGIAALADGVDGVLICLADMPRVSGETIEALLDAFRSAGADGPSVCVPVHRGKRGNPVLWDRTFFPDLRTLEGDMGARNLLSEHAEAVREVPVDDPGVLLDVDTREALARIREEEGRPTP